MSLELPPLPWPENALEPHISARTMSFHHGKHHKAYVDNLNGLIKDSPLAGSSLEDIVRLTAGDETKAGVFNNAAQVWNHTFFWNSMKPGGGKPSKAMAERIEKDFGSLDKFREQFRQAGTTQFGSGWAWLVNEGRQLKVTKTPNAVNPLVQGQIPLLTCDVWEHAYYLDYQNRRPDFIQAFLDHLANWDFAENNLAAAES